MISKTTRMSNEKEFSAVSYSGESFGVWLHWLWACELVGIKSTPWVGIRLEAEVQRKKLWVQATTHWQIGPLLTDRWRQPYFICFWTNVTNVLLPTVFPLLTAVKGSPSDPSWIGCWWLGYFICATGILATAIPLWFMPKSCSEKATITRKKEKIESAEGSNSADETTLSMASREIKG